MTHMQTQINPGLAQVLGAMNMVSPVTPQGTPTVAAQVMNAAQQVQMQPTPGMGDAAQQAGIGGAIQGMQMQEAQKELMDRAMQATKPPPGIAGLDPNIQGYADGGIVGYSGGGDIKGPFTGYAPLYQEARRLGISLSPYDSQEDRQRKIALVLEARQRPQFPPGPRAEIPTTPSASYSSEGRAYASPGVRSQIGETAAMPAPPAPAADTQPESDEAPLLRPSSAGIATLPAAAAGVNLFERARGRLENAPRGPVDPATVPDAAEAQRRADDEYRRRMGLPTQMDRIAQDEAGMARIMDARDALVARRMAELEKSRKDDGLMNFLLGARGFKGEGVGQVLKTGAQSARMADEAAKGRLEGLENLSLDLQQLRMDKQIALNKMRDAIATGDFNTAMEQKQKAQDADRALATALANLDVGEAKEQGEDTRSRRQQDTQLQVAGMQERGANARVRRTEGLERIKERQQMLQALQGTERTLTAELTKLAGVLTPQARTERTRIAQELALVRQQIQSLLPEELRSIKTPDATAAGAKSGRTLNWADIK